MKGRRLTKSQMYRFKVLKHWANLWKDKPEEMSKNLASATLSASKKRKEERKRLLFYIQQWPEKMTTEQFNQRLALLASLNACKRASLARLIRRHGFVCFNAKDMAWENKTKNEVA